MHFLHKILVYIPDALSEKEPSSRKELMDTIRNFAEEETARFADRVFDWRETDTAGRWQDRYPKNVILAKDDLDRFENEMTDVIESQYGEIQMCLALLKETVTTDLEEVIEGDWVRKSYADNNGNYSLMTPFYVFSIASLLYGEYTSDSCFYNTHDYTARLYPNDIEKVRERPEDWAFVMFDYHN